MNKFLSIAFAFVVAAATFSSQAQEIKGDANAGATKIAMCVGCHGIQGYQASFPEVYKVPKISGQGEKYIAASLTAYKKGERKHPTMRSIATSLTEQDIADLSAYYSSHGKVEGASLPEAANEAKSNVAALLTKGACTSCHGANLAKPIDPSYPKIAGQHADYLYVALKSYKVEGTSSWGRNNGVMAGVSKQFSNAELKELAKYVAAQQGDIKTVPQSRFR
jgi:cytochrome c553